MMARPYPTKNAGLLDSFLEHKMENERLRRRINDLKREEEEDADETTRSFFSSARGTSEGQTDEVADGTSNSGHRAQLNPDTLAMPPPAKPTISDQALTRQNLEGINASSRQIQ